MDWDKIKKTLDKYLPDETLEDRESQGFKTAGKIALNAMADKPGINGEIRPSFDLMDILPPELALGLGAAALKSGFAAKAAGAAKLGFPAIMGALKSDATKAVGGALENNGIKELAEHSIPLDMSEAARMERAKQMGFDTNKTYYHGTPEDIKNFKQDSFLSPNPEFANRFTTKTPQTRDIDGTLAALKNNTNSAKRIFDLDKDARNSLMEYFNSTRDIHGNPLVTPGSKDVVNKFAGKKFGEVYPEDALQKLNIPKDAFIDDHIKHIIDTHNELRNFNNGNGLGGNIIPTHVAVKNPFDYENPTHIENLVKKLNTTHSTSYVPSDFSDGYWETLERPKTINAIKNLGHDGMFVNEWGDKNLSVFDPNKIRSKFAAFDPSKADSNDLAAGVGATASFPLLKSIIQKKDQDQDQEENL